MRKIYMIGDSIMQTNLYDKYPQTGWGQMLSLFVCDDVEVVNLAKNGTSTKSFIQQKRFEMVENNIKNGDLLIIGFAHNDEKIQDENRYTNPKTKFKENLIYFIDVAKKNGASVILTTPVVRRNFIDGKLVETHGEYVSSIKEVSNEKDITCVDLNELTFNFFSNVGEECSKRYFMNFPANIYGNYPNGSNDNSHLRSDGAFLVSKLLVNDLYIKNNDLKDYFKEPASPIICASDTYEK